MPTTAVRIGKWSTVSRSGMLSITTCWKQPACELIRFRTWHSSCQQKHNSFWMVQACTHTHTQTHTHIQTHRHKHRHTNAHTNTHTQNTVEFPCKISEGKMTLNVTLTDTNTVTTWSASDKCHTAYNV